MKLFTSGEYSINLLFLVYTIHSLSWTVHMNKVFLVQMFVNKNPVNMTEINQHI